MLIGERPEYLKDLGVNKLGHRLMIEGFFFPFLPILHFSNFIYLAAILEAKKKHKVRYLGNFIFVDASFLFLFRLDKRGVYH